MMMMMMMMMKLLVINDDECNITPGFPKPEDVELREVQFKYHLVTILGSTPLGNEPRFINPGLTWLGMVSIPPTKMAMNGGWFMIVLPTWSLNLFDIYPSKPVQLLRKYKIYKVIVI